MPKMGLWSEPDLKITLGVEHMILPFYNIYDIINNQPISIAVTPKVNQSALTFPQCRPISTVHPPNQGPVHILMTKYR